MPTPTPRAELPPLHDDDVHLWWARTAPADDAPGQRRPRLDRLLRRVLARYAGAAPDTLCFGREAQGRPFLLGSGMPEFNLSDTRGGSVIAVARRARIGVDLERLDRQLSHRRLAQRFFSAAEAAELDAMDDEAARAAFLRLWTAKEASCKATGTGIAGWLAHWRFDPRPDPPQLVALPAEAGAASRWYHARLSPDPDYTVVLACRDIRPTVWPLAFDPHAD